MTSKIKVSLLFIGALILGVLLWGSVAFAGDPDSSDPPNASSWYSLEDLYQRLAAGTAGSSSVFSEPASGPGTGTMHTINEIMAVAPALDNGSGASPNDVLSGKTYWGLRGDTWGPQTGTAIQTASPSSSAVPKTGQVDCWNEAGGLIFCAGTGQDGEYRLGTGYASMPVAGTTGAYLAPSWTGTRFIVNGDGTVSDSLTALTWTQDSNCFGALTWTQALTETLSLNSGECNLSDGSVEGDWRMPNEHELHSLVDLSQSSPTLPAGHPFANVTTASWYWSSTTDQGTPSNAWGVAFSTGYAGAPAKSQNGVSWPVKGGQ